MASRIYAVVHGLSAKLDFLFLLFLLNEKARDLLVKFNAWSPQPAYGLFKLVWSFLFYLIIRYTENHVFIGLSLIHI